MRAKIFFHKPNELNKWPSHVIHCFAFNKWRETNDIFEMIFKLPFLTKYELGIHRIDLAHFLETVKSEIEIENNCSFNFNILNLDLGTYLLDRLDR